MLPECAHFKVLKYEGLQILNEHKIFFPIFVTNLPSWGNEWDIPNY